MGINYIICAAGEGQRFRDYFENIPKPLINLNGLSFLEWSLQSLTVTSKDQLILLTHVAHRIRERLEAKIIARYPFTPIKWIEIRNSTRGQLETAILAEEVCDLHKGIAIFNCDNYFQSPTLGALMANPDIAGIIPCFHAAGAAWSFCAIDEQDKVTQVMEKRRISEWASIGFYYFRDASTFFSKGKAALAREQDGEYFVAPLYQSYIDAGELVMIDRLALAKPMGTPEQLEIFWKVDVETLATQNLERTLVVDIDNTLTIDNPADGYSEKRPNTALIERLRTYQKRGFRILLFTSRRMATCGNDEALVLKRTGTVTLEWLERHNVPYDGIRFGKPYAKAGFYIDDKTIRPSEFMSLSEQEIIALLAKENQHNGDEIF